MAFPVGVRDCLAVMMASALGLVAALRRRLMAVVAVGTSRSQAGADFDGFGSADGVVAGEGLVPVVPGLNGVPVGVGSAGEAAVRPGLTPRLAGLRPGHSRRT